MDIIQLNFGWDNKETQGICNECGAHPLCPNVIYKFMRNNIENTLVVYYKKDGFSNNNFSKNCYYYLLKNSTSVYNNIDRQTFNDIITWKLNAPYPDASAFPLNHIETIEYAKTQSSCPDIIIDKLAIDPSRTFKTSDANTFNKKNNTYSTVIQNVKQYYLNSPVAKQKDFVIIPIIKQVGSGRSTALHALNQIFYFKDKDVDRCEIYVFDSANNDKGREKKQLCKANLQGYSETCSYWTTNFAILASSEYSSFQTLKNNIENGVFIDKLTKITSKMLDEKIFYKQIKNIEKLTEEYTLPQNSRANTKQYEEVKSKNTFFQQIHGIANDNIEESTIEAPDSLTSDQKQIYKLSIIQNIVKEAKYKQVEIKTNTFDDKLHKVNNKIQTIKHGLYK